MPDLYICHICGAAIADFPPLATVLHEKFHRRLGDWTPGDFLADLSLRQH